MAVVSCEEMKGLLNVQPQLFKAERLLALRETRYPITSFFTINEANVSKDGRWCVSFIDDDTREPMFNNVPLLENSILLFQRSKCSIATSRISENYVYAVNANAPLYVTKISGNVFFIEKKYFCIHTLFFFEVFQGLSCFIIKCIFLFYVIYKLCETNK